MQKPLLFINGKIIKKDEILTNHSLAVTGTKIESIATTTAFDQSNYDVIDLEGKYLAPGFIEMHCHGGNGFDFMDGTEEAIRGIADFHNLYGTTSMYATSLSGGEKETISFLETFEACQHEIESCNMLGVHLEGPYFAMSQKGAQDSKFIVDPNPEQYHKYLKFESVKRWSIAPERPGAMELGLELKKRSVRASIAHTEALYETCEEALSNGYNAMTHHYSAMPGVTRINAYRHGGAIEAGLLLDDYYVEVIADGSHLPKCLLQLIYKCKPKDKIILVTDAMRGAGMKPGSITKLGSLTHGQEVLIQEDVAMMPDYSSFAGSIATADRLVRTMTKLAEIPLGEAVNMITINPAKHMGIDDHKGMLAEGYDADLVIFDENINIYNTVVNGKVRDGFAAKV